jgi:hypothetical protein
MGESTEISEAGFYKEKKIERANKRAAGLFVIEE